MSLPSSKFSSKPKSDVGTSTQTLEPRKYQNARHLEYGYEKSSFDSYFEGLNLRFFIPVSFDWFEGGRGEVDNGIREAPKLNVESVSQWERITLLYKRLFVDQTASKSAVFFE